MSTYWQGHSKVKVNGTAETSSATQAGPGFAMTVTPNAAAPASFIITVTPTAPAVPAVSTAPVHAPPIHTASAG
jgi:hypothetical protein